MKYIVICNNNTEFETMKAHYSKKYELGSYTEWPQAFRISDIECEGFARLSYYQESLAYNSYKYVSFAEWNQLTIKSKSNMKYVVEVNSQQEAGAVYKHVKTFAAKLSFPCVVTSQGLNGSVANHKTVKFIDNYGPILSFKTFSEMFGVIVKANKTLKLTSDYDAVVNYNIKIVEVGCQSIPFTVVEELAKLIKE